MYNRYIPQPDGSYRRSRCPDPGRPPAPAPAPPPPPPPCPPELPKPKPTPPCPPPRPYRPKRTASEPEHGSIGAFLRQLLPSNFDSGDLLVILLLLLMSSDSCDDNSALLTLALYLFL